MDKQNVCTMQNIYTMSLESKISIKWKSSQKKKKKTIYSPGWMNVQTVMLRKKSQMQKTMWYRDFPGGPAVRTLCFQRRVSGLIPGGRTKDPTCGPKKGKKKKKKKKNQAGKRKQCKGRGQRLHALHPPTPPFTIIRPRDLGIGICKP